MNGTPAGYRAVRWLAKEVSETWFREHGAIETDRIPEGRGVFIRCMASRFTHRSIGNDLYSTRPDNVHRQAHPILRTNTWQYDACRWSQTNISFYR